MLIESRSTFFHSNNLNLCKMDKEKEKWVHICSTCMCEMSLGSARTGLIFTRIQEGAQLGGLTQPPPGQSEPGIPYHVPSGWVPVGGGAAWRELTRSSGAHSGGAVRESSSVLLVCFVYSFFLYRCCCCSLCLLFC